MGREQPRNYVLAHDDNSWSLEGRICPVCNKSESGYRYCFFRCKALTCANCFNAPIRHLCNKCLEEGIHGP